MKKTKSSIHCRPIVLVLFVVSWACWVSLETEAKNGKVLASRNDVNGADFSEWFEPAEDARNKTSTKQHQTAHRHKHGKQSLQAASSKVQQKPNEKEKRKEKVYGVVYIMTMNDCLNHPAPPFGKIGFSKRSENNCEARVEELQTGNPHQLVCNHMFPVTEALSRAEGRVKNNLTAEGHKIYSSCRGGTEWFSFPGGTLQGLVNRARAVLSEAGVLAQTSDWVESSINQSLSPNQSPQFVYNSKWRQVPCKGDELQHITYNCK